jgi:hypothetical protein
VDRAGGDANSAKVGIVGGHKGRGQNGGALERHPTECGHHTARQCWRIHDSLQNDIDPSLISTFERKDAGSKAFSTLLMFQGLTAQVPSCPFGYTEAVDVRLDAVVQMRNVLQIVVGRAHRRVAQKPQECSFFSVLLYDLLNDWQKSNLRRESREFLVELNISTFDSIYR